MCLEPDRQGKQRGNALASNCIALSCSSLCALADVAVAQLESDGVCY